MFDFQSFTRRPRFPARHTLKAMKSVENSIFSPRTTNTKQSSRPKSGPIRQLSLVERAAWSRLREKFFNFVTAYQRPARRARPRGFIYAIFPERIFKPLRAINSSRLFIYGRVAAACKQIQKTKKNLSRKDLKDFWDFVRNRKA